MRKTPPAVNPTTDRRTAKIRTKSLIRKSRNRTQRELSPSYPPSDGESRIENGNLAAKRRRSAEKISKYGLPQQKRILPASGTLRRPARENPELCQHFPAKINFSPARNRQSMPPIPEEYKRLKGCGHNQRPDPSPHGGNASYESRIFAVHLSRLPIRRAADPIDSPHNCCRSHRSRHFPQAKSSASVPTKENAITASFLEAQRPEFPSEERT